jgi:hypothetical protein
MKTRGRETPEISSAIASGYSAEQSHPVHLCGSTLGTRAHVCAFFSNAEEQHRALVGFVTEGLACGDKVVHTIDPARRDEYTNRWTSGGVDVSADEIQRRVRS